VHGTSNARIFWIGIRLLGTFFRLRRLRRPDSSEQSV